MALLDKPVSEFSVVINLTVQDHPDRAGLVPDRLVATFRIDHLKAAGAEGDAWCDMPPFVIGTAVKQPRHHLI